MKLGIGSYTYVWACGVPGYPQPAAPLTALALCDKAAQLGVSVVQIADNVPLHTLDAGALDALRQRADELGLELEVGTRGIAPDHLAQYVRIAERLRSRLLRVVIDTPTDRPSPAEAIARLAPLLRIFESADVTLAIENHDRFKATALLAIVEALRSRHVGVCLDTANSLGCLESVAQVVETLGPRTVNLHLKDVGAVRAPHNKGFVIEGRPAGQGQIDFAWVLKRLRECRVDPNAIVELWPPPEPTLAAAIEKEEKWAQESVTFARRLIPASEYHSVTSPLNIGRT
jgi:sugar phosphate isomerase/epimerase